MDELKDVLPDVQYKTNVEYKKPPRAEIVQWPKELEDLIKAGAIPLSFSSDHWHICPNCGGVELMCVFMKEAGPFVQPPFGKKSKWLEIDGREGWYTGETHYGYCPVCNQGRLEEWLRRNSGLDHQVFLGDFLVDGAYQKKSEAKAVIGRLLGMNKNPAGFVTLWGDYGCGKTMLMQALVSGFINIGVSARYITLSDLLAELRWMFSEKRGYQKSEEELQAYRRFKVLCIDEIGKVNLTGWVKETVNRLLDSRYESMETMLTVMATNYSPDRLPADWGYLKSRMYEGTIVNVPGPDMRKVLGGN